MSAAEEDILLALAGADPQGLRIAQIRKAMDTPPTAASVNTALSGLRGSGLVSRTPGGRWLLTSTGTQAVEQVQDQQRAELSELPSVLVPTPPDFEDAGSRVADPSQDRIIRAGMDEALVVEAGPGFGKTDVLCARVAAMLDAGTVPSKLLVLSFTRTAVHELRSRIRELSRTGRNAGGVRVTTLDSYAARIVHAIGGTVQSFEQTIAAAKELIATENDAVDEEVGALAHVFVDEAQDLVGLRAELVAALLASLDVSCGFTVFADPAQAIYDWSEEGSAESGEEVLRFEQRLTAAGLEFQKVKLDHLHRTHDPDLRRLLLASRNLVLDASEPERGKRLNLHLHTLVQGETVQVGECGAYFGDVDSGSMVLFRGRATALDVADRLAADGHPTKLRLGGLERVIEPWVARFLLLAWQDEAGDRLTRQRFERLWPTLGGGHWTDGWDADDAWSALRSLHGSGGTRDVVAIRRVSGSLASGRVPQSLVRDIGLAGPVVGTIHGSKGREADRVHLALWSDEEVGDGEERVLYVGLSRARESLAVLRFAGQAWSQHDGRNYRRAGARLRLEFGRRGDVLPTFSASGREAMAIQNRLWGFSGDPEATRIRFVKKAYRIQTRSGRQDLGGLDHSCRFAIRAAWDRARLAGRPGTIDWVRWRDVCTVAVDASDPGLKYVPKPFRDLRVWLCPVLAGFGLVYPEKSK